MPSENDNDWFVYMIRCDDDSLYTGITTDMVRRWHEHSRDDQQRSGRCKEEVCEIANNLHTAAMKSSRGAKFFRARKPLQLAYIESGHNRSSATRREAAIKRLSRAAKLQLLTADCNELHTLDRALLPMLATTPSVV
jgi:putative endonuclease